jgi:hypothetical protein
MYILKTLLYIILSHTLVPVRILQTCSFQYTGFKSPDHSRIAIWIRHHFIATSLLVLYFAPAPLLVSSFCSGYAFRIVFCSGSGSRIVFCSGSASRIVLCAPAPQKYGFQIKCLLGKMYLMEKQSSYVFSFRVRFCYNSIVIYKVDTKFRIISSNLAK